MSRKRHIGRWVAAVGVLAVVAAGAGVWSTDQGQQWWQDFTSDTSTKPPAEQQAAQAGLELPDLGSATAVAESVSAATAVAADPDKVARALSGVIGSQKMGSRVIVEVSNLSGGEPVFQRGPARFTPASTTKILTSTAALQAMDPGTTFDTRVVLQPGSAQVPQLVLVGGGDPYLASSPRAEATVPHRADLKTLAKATAKQLTARGITTVRLARDTSLFTGPTNNPKWEADYVPDGVVSPIVALWADRGKDPDGYGRVADPVGSATDLFAAALRAQNIAVRGKQPEVKAAADAEQVAVVQSAPLSEIVEYVLQVSDNEGAEILNHQVGVALSDTGSFAAGISGTRDMLSELGVDLTGWQQYDGSGLSRRNLFAPQTLTDALRAAAATENPHLRAVVTGLPVSGFNGSLAARFSQTDPRALGMVRAKTGTLTGVHGLAGVITDASGAVMIYVAVADRVPVEETLDARLGLEKISAALAACSCAVDQAGEAASSPPAGG